MPWASIEDRRRHFQEYGRKKYKAGKQQGLCVHHGCTKPAVGVRCEEHLEYYRRLNHRRAKKKITKRRAIEMVFDELFFKNEHGVWFFRVPNRDQYVPIPSHLRSAVDCLAGGRGPRLQLAPGETKSD